MALSDLIGVAFQVDDKEFFISSFDALGIEAADILVTPVNLFTLVYTVAALSPGRLITDAHLAFDGSATGDDDDTFGGGDDDDGEAIATVMESIFTGRGDLLGELQVLADSNIHPDDWVLVDDIVFDPQMSLTVTKTALFRAIGDDDDLLLLDCDSIASATFIRQTFSQIPAPGSLWLLGLAGAVAGIRRRQR
ncbi:MAG: PEP-CTERM sorting domain-containing protein [Planctomycetota bacterium]